jgi:hypothetical protein
VHLPQFALSIKYTLIVPFHGHCKHAQAGAGVDIEAWLRGLGLEKYIELFAANAVGLDVLPDLTDADLKELVNRSGIPGGSNF